MCGRIPKSSFNPSIGISGFATWPSYDYLEANSVSIPQSELVALQLVQDFPAHTDAYSFNPSIGISGFATTITA